MAGAILAKYYDVERSESANGPWDIVGYNLNDADQFYTPLYNDYSVGTGKKYYYRVIAKNSGGVSEPSNVVGPVEATCKTLIDEMRNFTVLYSANGDMRIKTDRDREFKEIQYRIETEKGSFLVYYVPGHIAGVKCNSFSKEDMSSLSFQLSETGSDYISPEIARQSFYLGKGDYNYWIPSQYKMDVITDTGKYSYLKITAEELSQLARIEIDYVPFN